MIDIFGVQRILQVYLFVFHLFIFCRFLTRSLSWVILLNFQSLLMRLVNFRTHSWQRDSLPSSLLCLLVRIAVSIVFWRPELSSGIVLMLRFGKASIPRSDWESFTKPIFRKRSSSGGNNFNSLFSHLYYVQSNGIRHKRSACAELIGEHQHAFIKKHSMVEMC